MDRKALVDRKVPEKTKRFRTKHKRNSDRNEKSNKSDIADHRKRAAEMQSFIRFGGRDAVFRRQEKAEEGGILVRENPGFLLEFQKGKRYTYSVIEIAGQVDSRR